MSSAFSRFSRPLIVGTLTLLGFSLALAEPQNQPLVGEGMFAVTSADVAAELAPMDVLARKQTLSSPDKVLRIATDIYIRRRLAEEAIAQRLDQSPEVQQILKIVRERVLADALGKHREMQSRPSAPVLESLARQNYLAQQARFQQPERIRARHILIPLKAPGARDQAEALRKQILEGASFEELAKKNSKDPNTAPKGGDLGLFARGKMVKSFEDAAFALAKPGDVTEVIESQFGYHVAQLVEKHPPGVQPFDEVKEQLIEEAAGGIATNARQEAVRPILEAAKPHPEAIEAFSATYR